MPHGGLAGRRMCRRRTISSAAAGRGGYCGSLKPSEKQFHQDRHGVEGPICRPAPSGPLIRMVAAELFMPASRSSGWHMPSARRERSLVDQSGTGLAVTAKAGFCSFAVDRDLAECVFCKFGGPCVGVRRRSAGPRKSIPAAPCRRPPD